VRITTSIKNNAPITDRACKPKKNGLVSGPISKEWLSKLQGKRLPRCRHLSAAYLNGS